MLLPLCRENTLTKGLSPLEFLESHTQSGTGSRCPLCQTAPGRIPHLPAHASRGRDLDGCECSPCRFRALSALVCSSGSVQSSGLTPFNPRGRCLASAILEIAAG